MVLSLPEDNDHFYDTFLLALAIWREARGEQVSVKTGVAWVVRNRAEHPSWWGGPSIVSVILRDKQFSSFNRTDPNATKFPLSSDVSWHDSIQAAIDVLGDAVADPTNGSTYYFDKSLDTHPPTWATTGNLKHSVDLGSLRFYRIE